MWKQMYLVHTLPFSFLNIHCNTNVPSMPGSCKHSSSFHTKTLYAFLFCPICATCLAHITIFNLVIQILFGEEYKLWSFSLRHLLHSPVTSSLLESYIFLSTLFLNTHSLYSFLNIRNQVSYPHKTNGKIIILCTLVFSFLIGETKIKDILWE